jgi:hypothetical protein
MVIGREQEVRSPFAGKLLLLPIGLTLLIFAMAIFGPMVSSTPPPDPGDSGRCVAEQVVMSAFEVTAQVYNPAGELVAFTVTKFGVEASVAHATFALNPLDGAYQNLVNANGSTPTHAWGATANNSGQAGLATELLEAGDEYVRLKSSNPWRLFKNHNDYSWNKYRSRYCNIDWPDQPNWNNPPSWLFRLDQ